MTRSRAKKMKETLHGLIRSMFKEAKTIGVEDKPTLITLLKVKEDHRSFN